MRKKGWNKKRDLPKSLGVGSPPRKTLKTKLQDTMLHKLLNFAVSRPKQWAVSKSTTIMGVILILNAVASILKHIIAPDDIDVNILQAEWENIMLGVGGLGLLESKSNQTKSEDIEKVTKK